MNNTTDTGGIATGARLMLASLIRLSQRSGNSQKSLPTIACSETNDTTYHVIISNGASQTDTHFDVTLYVNVTLLLTRLHIKTCIDLN